MDVGVVSPPVAVPLASVDSADSTSSPRPVKRVALGGFVDSDDEEDDDVSPNTTTTPAMDPVQEPSRPQVNQAQQTQHSEPASTAPRANANLEDDTNMHDAQIPSQAELDDLLAQTTPPNEIPEDQDGHSQVPVENEEEDRYDLLFSAAPAADETLLASTQPTTMSTIFVQTCSGRAIPVRQRSTPRAPVPYEAMVAQRSKTKEGRAQRNFYGIAIHELVDGARHEIAAQKEAAKKKSAAAADEIVQAAPKPTKGKGTASGRRPKRAMLWTEKYRARSFMDLVGDDLTNRLVLRWLKRWDPLVFPGARKRVPLVKAPHADGSGNEESEKPHRKILILTGPPGLGKTTLAHVCARQAGYEVLEINASDDRSRDVVNGRIRTSLGTESVKAVEQATLGAATADGKKTKVARPVCVIVDEVDGVVGGSGSGGEGGFVKALIDLVLLDQKNAGGATSAAQTAASSRSRRSKRGDDFRQMRPLILICNDIYHPALRPLRLSGLAEIVHVGKPTVEAVVTRLKVIFEKEGIPCEKEAARKLCEAAWGMATGSEAARRGTESTAEGDLRGVMVVGEWVARRLRATASVDTFASASPHLTRTWVDKHVLPDLASGGGEGGGIGARGLGRGGVREIVTRIFQEGAGFPKTAASTAGQATSSTSTASATATSANTSYRHEQPKGQMSFAEAQQRYAMGRLREMIETSGDVDRIMTDIFGEYPHREFNDDSYLSKPDAAYEWMHFHDACARRVFGSQEWELAPYTSQPVLACHQLFATSRKYVPDDTRAGEDGRPALPFTGPRADFLAREAEKHSRAALQAIQAQLPPSLLRAFRNAEDLAADFLPYVLRLVSPDVKPVLINVAAASNAGANGKSSGPTAVASVRREGEKKLVRRAAEVLAELGIKLQRGMLEDAGGPSAAPVGRPQWVYRMEPDLDMLVSFESAGGLLLSGSSAAPTRYAVRQVLDQELRKTLAARDNAARQARFQAGTALGAPLNSNSNNNNGNDDDKENRGNKRNGLKRKSTAADLEEASVKRDFFGRIIAEVPTAANNALQDVDGNAREGRTKNSASHAAGAADDDDTGDEGQRVWVTFHEGLNNAVRKPISVDEFLRGL